MNRYLKAALWGFDNPRDWAGNGPDWLRGSPAMRAAAEIGAYYWRKHASPPESLAYLGGRNEPTFMADTREGFLRVCYEYPGVVVRHS